MDERPRREIAPLLAAAVAACAALCAFALGRWSAPAAADFRIATRATRPIESGEAGAAEVPRLGERAAVRDRARASRDGASPDALDAAVAELEAAIAADLAQRAVGADITGTVRLGNGEPAAGVVVAATPDPPLTWTYDERPLAAQVREDAQYEGVRRVGRRRATTGADGSFRITGLVADFSYDIDADVPLHAIDVDQLNGSEEVRPGGAVHLIARPKCRMILDLVARDGTRIEEARAELEGRTGGESLSGQSHEWTRATPAVHWLDPGTWSGIVLASGHRGEIPETEIGPAETVTVRVEMRVAPAIRVEAELPAGMGRNFLIIQATQSEDEDGEHGDPEAVWDGTAAVFASLPAGRWWVRATYDSDRIAMRELADTSAGPVTLRWKLPEPDARDFVIVRVLAPDGSPARDAKVMDRSSYGCCGSDWSREADPVGAGVFRLVHGYRHDCSGARFGFEVTSAVWGSRKVEYVPVRDADVTVRLPYASPLSIRVPAGDRPWVRIASVADGESFAASAYESDSFTAKFARVPHGDYDVTADSVPDTVMRVRIPAAGIVDYAGVPCNAWRITEVEIGSAAAAAGFLPGDVVAGLDGAVFETAAELRRAWRAASRRGRVAADVRRDGRPVRVDAVRDLDDDDDFLGLGFVTVPR